ncbi:succinate-acetate transporter protein [Dysgonomonas sp. PH5-45]|uniref:acetate uptake transporter n=1 Tax=unclassified Dysgonomonas TaxID=2630389 RepID=UPI002474D9CE|nr:MULTISPECIES: acetate uptake transporter [unclassified Dysgonomonas]MDH6355650.1 succinate-acetate transporter protein [Dysgonomonas sp. PH5-45]MDH6388547.1 succinate-acetate transporter protein [Dysgonomonas sp. PH5-37]
METKNVKIQVADPTTLGLFGLAIVTLVASSQKLGLTDGLAFVLPWALFLGGMAQIIAAIFDFKHNNLFGATAFSAYGLFWVGMAMSWLIKLGCLGETLASTADTKQLGFVFLGYMILTIALTVSGLKMSKAMFVLLFLIVLLFLGLALDSFGFGHFWHSLAAYSELAISLLTFYVLSAKYLNSFFGKNILPVGAPFLK